MRVWGVPNPPGETWYVWTGVACTSYFPPVASTPLVILEPVVCAVDLSLSLRRGSGGAIIPHLNFSIPANVLAPLWEVAARIEAVESVNDVRDASHGFRGGLPDRVEVGVRADPGRCLGSVIESCFLPFQDAEMAAVWNLEDPRSAIDYSGGPGVGWSKL